VGCRGTAAGLFALLAATTNCAGQAVGDEELVSPEVEEPLDLSVDRVDVVHGALRVAATMAEGSAELSIWLGEGCDPREVGRGMATPSKFVWMFGARELAASLRCGLVVLARATTVTGRVRKVAPVPVVSGLEPLDSDEAPPGLEWSPEDIALAVLSRQPLRFGHVSFGVALSVGGTPLEGDEAEATDDVGSASE
jgi:hypothetical protein